MSHQIKKNLGAIVRHNGVEFRVWAPFAKNVKLLTPYLGVFDGSNTYDMLSENDGDPVGICQRRRNRPKL